MSAAILVFSKAPRAGEVKTRLIPALGAEGAARLHRSLLERVMDEARAVADARLELWCASADPLLEECALVHGAIVREQRGSDLGERMAHAFDSALPGISRAVLVGSDVPSLDRGYLRRALRSLEQHAAVVGPAEDGGYVLIGLRRPAPALFSGIEWGGGKVMAQTRLRLTALGLDWVELETLWDVDRPEDLARLSR